MELVQQLKKDGIEKGLCRMWQMKLKSGLSIKSLVELFINGIDFCIKNDYPTLDFMRQNFKGKCESYGAYVDDEVFEKNRRNIVLNGDCKAMLEYDGYTVANLYVRHGSKGAINVSDHAIVTIDAFDDSDIAVAVSGDDAVAFVNIYGNAKVECIGLGIKVFYKNKKTY